MDGYPGYHGYIQGTRVSRVSPGIGWASAGHRLGIGWVSGIPGYFFSLAAAAAAAAASAAAAAPFSLLLALLRLCRCCLAYVVLLLWLLPLMCPTPMFLLKGKLCSETQVLVPPALFSSK